MNKLRRLFYLQMFADGDADPADNQDNDSGEKGDTAEPEETETKEKEPEKKYSDKDVDEIINKKYAKWKADSEKELKDAKAEATKLAKMNAEQKQQYEIEKLTEENKRLKAQAVKAELGKTAATLLKEQNIDATQDMLDFVVGSDADTTKQNIDKFVSIIQAQLKAAEVERAKGTTPQRYGGQNDEKSEIQKRIDKYIRH